MTDAMPGDDTPTVEKGDWIGSVGELELERLKRSPSLAHVSFVNKEIVLLLHTRGSDLAQTIARLEIAL